MPYLFAMGLHLYPTDIDTYLQPLAHPIGSLLTLI